jgi:hypothetical protein
MEQFVLGNTGLDPLIRTANDRVIGRFGHLNKLVNAITALQEVPPGSGLQSVVGGTGIEIDDTIDPLNPTINCTITQADIASGTWTPTFSGGVFALSNPVLNEAKYSRVGDIVTCTIRGSVDVDFTGLINYGYFTFTFPITPISGVNAIGSANLDTANLCNGLVKQESIQFSSADTSFAGADLAFYAIFQYNIE